ncbi:MAG: glycosyltransferase family 4 protein [Pseudomonadota bacterium]
MMTSRRGLDGPSAVASPCEREADAAAFGPADMAARCGDDRAAPCPTAAVRASHGTRPLLLFVAPEDRAFVTHRLPLAEAAQAAGMRVAVATRDGGYTEQITQRGIDVHFVDFDRARLNPLHEVRTLRQLRSLIRELSPDVVHNQTLKPVIYGTFAARGVPVRRLVNALGGLGYVFSSTSWRANLLRKIASLLLRRALRDPRSLLVLQNDANRDLLVDAGIVLPQTIRMIRGAGVDPEGFPPCDANHQPPTVVLPARLLRDKGVYEFVEAARLLKDRGVEAGFALVGEPDPLNPTSVTEAEVNAWQDAGLIDAWGWIDDMRDVYAQAQIVCLPSYHEGLPRALLEASAARCAIVASDVPGCRDVVVDGETGLLAPVRDATALADRLADVIADATLRRRLGAAARARVADVFSLDTVIAQFLELYGVPVQTATSPGSAPVSATAAPVASGGREQ